MFWNMEPFSLQNSYVFGLVYRHPLKQDTLNIPLGVRNLQAIIIVSKLKETASQFTKVISSKLSKYLMNDYQEL